MNQTPILFLGDAPSVPGGLSRIGRDLAILTSRMEEFRVGFLGRGGLASRHLPFAQYNYPEFDGWGERYLQDVWGNFAGDEPGIVMTIWDPSRLLWLNPKYTDQQWLKERPFKLWGYFPIDHEGVGGKLSLMETEALRAYDRVLAYGMYGSGVISRSLDYKEACGLHPPWIEPGCVHSARWSWCKGRVGNRTRGNSSGSGDDEPDSQGLGAGV